MCEEMVPVHWGKVADIAISGEQLVSTAPLPQCTVPLFIECSSVCLLGESFVASGSDPTYIIDMLMFVLCVLDRRFIC